MLKNFKTSIPAIIILIAVVLYWAGVIDAEKFSLGVAAFSSLGLLGARDYTNETNFESKYKKS